MTAQPTTTTTPAQEIWLAPPTESEPDAPQPTATPTIGVWAVSAAALFIGLALALRVLKQRRGQRRKGASNRRRRSGRSDADIAFARLARLMRLSREERDAAASRAAVCGAHPVAALLCEHLEPASVDARAADSSA